MIKRQPEPELMDDAEQALAYASADFEEPHENFVKLIQETFPTHDFSGTVLDLGCGPADITLRFARRFPGAIIDGVDGAEAMLSLGRQAVEAEGMRHRIQLLQCYLPADTLPHDQYDAVICNSLLHHLQNPLVLWQTLQQYAKPGAPVFVMDLMRPQSTAEAQQLMETYAANEAEILRHDFYHSLLAAYTVEEITQQLREAALPHLQVNIVSDRHITVSGYR